MGISPWPKTSIPTAPRWIIQLIPDSGIFDITGLTTDDFSLRIQDLKTGEVKTGAGTFSALTAAVTTTVNSATVIVSPAQISYQLASVDVALGRFKLTVIASMSNGDLPFLVDEDWQVVAL